MILELKNIYKAYIQGNMHVPVLKDINFEIEKGSIFGLLGPSGAGKTTIIKILTGQIVASCGESVLLGKSSEQLSGEDYNKIGIMMDNFGLYERMSCYDNLKFFCKIMNVSNSKINEVLKKVGLLEAAKTSVSDLSKGMRCRMLLARAILNNPSVLFLDEPTLGLDVLARSELWDVIRSLKGEVTIILTTHYMEEAESLSDRVAIMKDGKLLVFDTSEQIKKMAEVDKFEEAFIRIVKGVSR